MNQTCPTVVVKGQTGEALIINASDFDKKKYKLFENENKATLSVVKKDDKFVIVNGEGIQVGEEGYTTKKDAKTMLDLLMGK